MSLESSIPKEIEEQEALALELHQKLYPDPSLVEPEPEPPAPEPDPEPQPEPEPQEDWEQKYKSLKGKYDKEVPRLAQDLRELKQTLESRHQEPAPAPTPSPIDERIEKLRAEYGDELVEDWKAVARAIAREELQPVIEKTQVFEDTAESLRQQEFKAELTKYAPTWQEHWTSFVQASNGLEPSDPKFIEFLESTEPNGLYTYGDMLMEFNSKWDAAKMSRIFQIYEATQTKPSVHQTQPITPPPAPDALVAPSRATSNPTPASTDARIWTQADMNQFYRDQRTGKYSAEEEQILWNDLLLAPAQGRVRG